MTRKFFTDTRRYRGYSDQDIINKAKEVKSIAGLLKALELRPVGGNYINIKRHLQRLNVDTKHWTGQGWSIGLQTKDYSEYVRSSSIKIHLVDLRGHRCENCGISEWLSKPIVMEMDHMDGDRTNNDISNLKLLCPNCHSQTETWRYRKRKPVWSSTWD